MKKTILILIFAMFLLICSSFVYGNNISFEVEKGNGTSYSSSDLWTDYYFVLHMRNSSNTVIDSAGNHNFTATGAVSNISDGAYAHSYYFNVNDARLECSNANFKTGNNTVIYFYKTNDTTENTGFYFDNGDDSLRGGPGTNIAIFGQISYQTRSDSTHEQFSNTSNEYNDETWKYVVHRQNGGDQDDQHIYVNMTEDTTEHRDETDILDPNTEQTASANCHFGGTNGGSQEYQGWFDEFRLAKEDLGIDYINDTWQNYLGTEGYGDVITTDTTNNITIINCSNVHNGTPIMINGTSGVKINGYTEYIWTDCDGKDQIYIHFVDQTDYYVSNEDYTIESETYNLTAIEFTTQNFLVNVSWNTSVVSNITSIGLIWNETEYTTGLISNGSDWVYYNKTITMPNIGLEVDVNFSWKIYYTLIDDTTNVVGETENRTQTIHIHNIDNCSTYSMRAINLTIRDDDNDSIINGSIDGYFRVWNASESSYSPFNLTWANGNYYGICIYPNTSVYSIYGQLEYVHTGYQTKSYYFENITFTNQSSNITLYLTSNSTRVTFTVVDEDDVTLEGITIRVLKYDLGTDSFKTTEILRTDSDGEAIANSIVLYTEWYQFILLDDGTQIFESEPTKISTTTKTFRVAIGSDYFQDYNTIMDIVGDVTFTNATLTFSFTFNDVTGDVTTGCLDVVRRTLNGDTKVNTSCVTSTSSTINLQITETVSNYTYVGTGFVYINGNRYVLDTETANFYYSWKTFDTDGILVSFFLIVTLAMVGLFNPIAAIVLMLVGFFLTNILGFFHLDWTYLITLIILGGLAIYKLGKYD